MPVTLSKLDMAQILKAVFDEDTQSLKTSGTAGSVGGGAAPGSEMSIEIDANDGDNIAVRPLATDTADMLSTVDASTDQVSSSVDILNARGYAIQTSYSSIIGAGDGSIVIQASLDDVIWTAVSVSPVVIGDDSILFNADGAYYKYVRVSYLASGNTGGTVTAKIVVKGQNSMGQFISVHGIEIDENQIPVYATQSDLPADAVVGDRAFVISDLFEFDGTSWILSQAASGSVVITDIDATTSAVDIDLGQTPTTTDEVRRFHILSSDNPVTFSSGPSTVVTKDEPFIAGDLVEAWTVLQREPVLANTTQPNGSPNTVRWIIESGVIELERGPTGGLFNAITGGGFQSGNNTGCRWYNDEFAPAGNVNFQQAYDGAIGDNFT